MSATFSSASFLSSFFFSNNKAKYLDGSFSFGRQLAHPHADGCGNRPEFFDVKFEWRRNRKRRWAPFVIHISRRTQGNRKDPHRPPSQRAEIDSDWVPSVRRARLRHESLSSHLYSTGRLSTAHRRATRPSENLETSPARQVGFT